MTANTDGDLADQIGHRLTNGGTLRCIRGSYVITDHTTGGYLQRSTYITHAWRSMWDQDLNLLELSMDNKYNVKDVKPGDRDYNRFKRAQARHLRLLKEYLGLVPANAKEARAKDYIYATRFGSDAGIKRLVVSDKRITHIPANRYENRHSANVVEVTPEKKELMERYNQLLNEARAAYHKLFK